jgi:transposase
MKSYSEDLRHKIVAAVERGMSKTEVARLFDVSLSSVKRYSRTARYGPQRVNTYDQCCK